MHATHPPGPTTTHQGQEHVEEADHGNTARHSEHPLPRVFAVSFLVLGLAHLAVVPGTAFDSRRYGWDGSIWGNPPLFITWPLGLLILSAAILCFVLAALRPLGLPFGPRNWMRWMVGGAVTSIIFFAFAWPGLEPNAFLFAVVPLADIAILSSWIARRFFQRGLLAEVENHVGPAPKRGSWPRRVARRTGVGFGTFLAILAVSVVTLTLVPAWTPQIVDAKGNQVPGSIAKLETVKLGGVNQTVLIRGWNTRNPVLLFLFGGPGGSALAQSPRLLTPLEKHFTIAYWEQRGSVKSWDARNPSSRLTVHQFISDTIQLTNHLRTRFHQPRIYLLGHSWGSILGIRVAQQRPDLFAAYIGGSQMVNNRLTDQSIYKRLLQHGIGTGDRELVRTLRQYGPPPYYGAGMDEKYNYVIPQARDVFEAPHTSFSDKTMNTLIHYFPPFFMPEFTLADKIRYWENDPASRPVFRVMYPQLQHYDFRRDAASLGVPVYMILGQYDVNGTGLSVDYFKKLRAPRKHLYIFRNAGHPEIFEQANRFTNIMINTVLRETRASVASTAG